MRWRKTLNSADPVELAAQGDPIGAQAGRAGPPCDVGASAG
jgi:hypothetical protein